jgi:signal transduction histidine kinase
MRDSSDAPGDLRTPQPPPELSSDWYRRMIDLLPMAVYTCEAPSGVITFYNDHAAMLWGRSPKRGDTDQRFCGSFKLWRLDGTLLPHEETPMALALLQGRQFRNEDVVIERPDGSRVTVLVNIDPIRDASGVVVGAVNAFHDVTALKEVERKLRDNEERLRESDRKKDEFLAILAHELRNPLAPIRAGLELIRVSGNSPESVDRVRSMIDRQVGYMVRLIDDLLDVSRINAGKISLQRKPMSIADLVNRAVEANRPVMTSAGLELGLELPEGSLEVLVDQTRFVQVLSNLLHNAMKFTPPGGRVTIRADVSNGAVGAAGWLVIRVADTGTGMTPEMVSRAFDLFTQGEPSPHVMERGLGVGLALARQLVELHGGTIEARSEGPNRGSEFTIVLPIAETVASVDEPLQSAPNRLERRVLIVDDNQDGANALAMLIEVLGGEPRVAYHGCRRPRDLPSLRAGRGAAGHRHARHGWLRGLPSHESARP